MTSEQQMQANEQQMSAKRSVGAVTAGPYSHPLHPMLVTVPIGAWVAGLVFGIASHVVDDPAFLTRGSMWLIAVGVLGALAAAVAGFLDLLAVPPATRARRTALVHMTLNLLVTCAYVAGFLWRHAAGSTQGVGAGMLALSAASLAVLGVSGHLGGRLAHRYGVRVADEATQAEGCTGTGSSAGRR
ncbi:DUF2231 domain-containing protein [Streptomyces sp. NRRL B-24484]|uniref:DUF2231 domain-containing protein n=1 Tax=Streptomyces sp. NRRL B-24484 TaxID=1463833 RepID=UPI000998D64E|nr:DUF2231 domain-containing protein [Streptomyces sp. NRRL B-24484]